MSDVTAEYVDKFWAYRRDFERTLVLIGLELLIIQTNRSFCCYHYSSYHTNYEVHLCLYSIAVRLKERINQNNFNFNLSGLRGGISIACCFVD
jgi:hypothetical protein